MDRNPFRRFLRGATWVAVLVLELWFLLYDVSIVGSLPAHGLNSELGAPLARVEETHRDVHLQNPSDVVWTQVKEDELLHEGQSLMTLDDSAAKVRIFGGGDIVLGPNTLVQWHAINTENGDGLMLELLRGSLAKSRSTEPSDFIVKIGERTLKASSETSLSLSRPTRQGGTQIQVTDGEVEVKSSQGVEVVKKGYTLSGLSDSGSENPEKSSLQLVAPLLGASFEFRRGKTVELRWEGVDPGNLSRVEVSRFSDFRELAAQGDASETFYKFLLPERPTGLLYFWRVRSGNKKSEAGQFWVTQSYIPQLIFPQSGVSVLEGESVSIAWEPVVGIKKYEVEVFQGGDAVNSKRGVSAVDSHESRSILRIPTQSNSSEISRLPPGTYVWRVRSEGENPYDWSESRVLYVRARAPVPPPPSLTPPSEFEKPEIIRRKKFKKTSFLWDFLIPSAEAAQNEDLLVKFKWKPVEGAVNYHIQVARDEEFTHMIAEGTSPVQSWNWAVSPSVEKNADRIYYRVASVNRDGVSSSFSPAMEIHVKEAIAAFAREREELRNRKAANAESKSVNDLSPKEKQPKPEPPKQDPPIPKKEEPPNKAENQKNETSQKATQEAARATKPKTPSPWSFIGILSNGITTFQQRSSASGMSQVDAKNFYLDHAVAAELVRTNPESRWHARLTVQPQKFSIAGSSEYSVHVRADGWVWNILKPPSFWALGMTVDYSSRFRKPTPGTLESAGQVSIGPATGIMFTGRPTSFVWPRSIGIITTIPLSGAFYGGQAGVHGHFWSEWRVMTLSNDGRNWLGLLFEGDVIFLYWKKPSSTRMFAFSVWGGVSVHIGGIFE